MDQCSETDSISATKEKLESDLISRSSVSFYSVSTYVSVLVAAGSSVSKDSGL